MSAQLLLVKPEPAGSTATASMGSPSCSRAPLQVVNEPRALVRCWSPRPRSCSPPPRVVAPVQLQAVPRHGCLRIASPRPVPPLVLPGGAQTAPPQLAALAAACSARAAPVARATSPTPAAPALRRWSPPRPCRALCAGPAPQLSCSVLSRCSTEPAPATAPQTPPSAGAPPADGAPPAGAAPRPRPPSPPADGRLAQQLRELQEAKDQAAAQSALSDEWIAARRDSLRRETMRVLNAGPGRLAEVLRCWPSPYAEGAPAGGREPRPSLTPPRPQAAERLPSSSAEACAAAADDPHGPGLPPLLPASAAQTPAGDVDAGALGPPDTAQDRQSRFAEPPCHAGAAAPPSAGGPPPSPCAGPQAVGAVTVVVSGAFDQSPPDGMPAGGRPGAGAPPNCAVAAREAFAAERRRHDDGQQRRDPTAPPPDGGALICTAADEAEPPQAPWDEGGAARAAPAAAPPRAASPQPGGAGRAPRPRSPRASSPPPRASGAPPKRRGSSASEPAPEGLLEGELEQYQAVLARCAQALTLQQLRELKALQHPPGAVGAVLEAAALLLGDARPQGARRLLQRNLPERLRGFELDDVTLGQARRLQRLLLQPGFDEESVGAVCPAALPLAIWCRTVGAYLAKAPGGQGAGAGAGAAEELQEPQPQPEPAEVERSPAGAAGELGPEGLLVSPDLEALGAEERRCVHDLRVERPGVGSIVFHGPTDCTGLDVARLVRLSEGEVLVYPEASSKPPPGQGLNARATVTMHRCWPPQGRSRLQDGRSQERYREKIRTMTEERGAMFLDYDCNTGVWRFQVEHF